MPLLTELVALPAADLYIWRSYGALVDVILVNGLSGGRV